jgi:hypothetical protein
MSDTEGQFDVDAAMDAALAEPETAPEATEAPPEVTPEPVEDPAAPDVTPDGTATADEAPPVPEVDLSKYLPLDQGDPFTFRVDKREVALDGAKVIGDKIVIPTETWRRSMHTMLADRNVVRDRESTLRREIQTLQAGQSSWQQEKSALLSEIDKLFSDPAAAQQFLENWQVNGPRLRAEMKAQAYEAQLRQVRERDIEEQRQRQEAELVPQLFDQFAEVIETWLDEQGIDWANDPDRTWGNWLRETWEDHGPQAFFVRDPVSGRFEVNEERAQRLFLREANRYKATAQKQAVVTKQVEQKAKMNQAAIAPPKPKPPVPTKPAPRASDGTFTKKPSEKMTKDEWEDWFNKTKFVEA